MSSTAGLDDRNWLASFRDGRVDRDEMTGSGGGGPGLNPFCGEHPAEEALGVAFAEAEVSAEMERQDPGQVHEVGHVVNLQTERG